MQQWHRLQGGFDFSEFDPIPAAFDLRVCAAVKIDQPINPHSGQVSSLVQTISGMFAEWIGDEGSLGFLRISPVSEAQPDSPDIEIADLPCRKRTESLVKHEQFFSTAGCSDWNGALLILGTGRNRIVAAGNRRFRWTIKIRECHLRQALHPVDQ